jgi:heptosyltransferase I
MPSHFRTEFGIFVVHQQLHIRIFIYLASYKFSSLQHSTHRLILRSICVIRLSAIGDVCNAAAAVLSIQRHYPNASITWVIGSVEAELLKGLPGIKFYIFDKKIGLKAYLELKKEFQGKRFDVLLLMQLSLRANLASAFISAHRRIGFDRELSKEFHSLFINERIEPTDRPHVLDKFLQFGKAIGVPVQNPVWNLPISLDDDRWALQQFSKGGLGRNFVICPSASSPERNWLPKCYAEIANYAAQKGFAVYLCGGPSVNDRQLGDLIKKSSSLKPNQLFDLIGQTNLRQLLALIKHATVLLAPDTGPVHMATAVGTPVIGLYGHSNPERTGPYKGLYVVEAYQHHLLDQISSFKRRSKWGARVKGSHVMHDISVTAVKEMFDRVLKDRAL